MTLNIGNITFDCEDPTAMATFWSEAIGRPIDPGASGFFASIGTAEVARPRWLFLKVPEGKTAKNRCHLDFETEDRATEVVRLVALGATHVADKAEWGHEWSVLTDPEGNEFCVAGGPAPTQQG